MEQAVSAEKAIKMLALIKTVQEMVVEEGKELIEGHLYAQVLNKLSLDEFNYVLDTMKQAKVIKVENNVISKR
jgi:protein-disulfide isomerase-like protein with CxxC motif